ncbi:hypothetical protein QUF70_21180, partial [Desulfobacterales bacterium HSG17]|nr:hypothetical protein [Desulfobacterales bacterium HSG17]
MKALLLLDSIGPDIDQKVKDYPKSIDEAVEKLISELSLKDRTLMANMDKDELIDLTNTLGLYIRNKFGLWEGNNDLLESCKKLSGEEQLDVDDASMVIVQELWKKLHKTNVLRLVKQSHII